MSFLIANLPPVSCYVRMEYLYDLKKGHGKLTPAIWIALKTIKGRALYIESLLTDYGALYDKLPISAYVWKEDVDHKNLIPLHHLELWDAFSYYSTVLVKETLKGLNCFYIDPSKNKHQGEYMFTIDQCHADPNTLNCGFTETPDEHKSFNVIKLKNGQFAAQPNNRIGFYERSLIPAETKTPDFKVSTQYFYAEDGPKWTAGDSDKYFYELMELK